MGAPKNQVPKICTVCNKAFSVIKSREHKASVCSRECKGKVTAAKYQKARIKRECLVCGKEIEVIQSRAERAGKYCSWSCHNVGMARMEHKTWADGNESYHSGGYVLIRSQKHPFTVGGYVFKHRLAMENLMREVVPDHKFLVSHDGVKYLRREIQVHHIDENKEHNETPNLIACTAAAHRDMHGGRPVLEGEIYPDYDWIKKREYRGVKRICKSCQGEFFLSPSAVADGRGKFCSLKCRQDSIMIDVNCKCCKKTFATTKEKFSRVGGQFCSDLCRVKP